MRRVRGLLSLVAIVLALLWGTLESVLAQTTSLPVSITDTLGFLWDIQGDGAIANGTAGAYNGGHVLSVSTDGTTFVPFPAFATATTEEAGREIVIGPAAFGSVQVVRKVYIAPTGSFARFLEVLTNTGSTAQSVTVRIYTNLGSDGIEPFFSTSSGDVALGINDNWVVTDDTTGGAGTALQGDPAVVHTMVGAGGVVYPSAVAGGQNAGYVQYQYVLTLAPGQTRIAMHFGAQRANGPDGVTTAQALASLAGEALAGMSPAELRRV
jgi:hypothetical protein